MRFLRPLLALLLVVASLAGSVVQPAARQRWVRTTVFITAGGVARSYLVVRPASSGTALLPVMMELHGAGATAGLELDRSGFLTDSGPAILVYPAGVNTFWNAGACCGQATADDVTFVTDVVAQVLADQPLADPSRVYLSGYSNGGRLAYRIACEKPALFTAIAVFGAVDSMDCARPPAVSMLIADGTADAEVTFAPTGIRHVVTGYVEPALTEEVQQYRVANGCTIATTRHTTGRLTSTTWTGCASGHPVVLALYAGVDHSWPLTTATTPGMAAIAWQFFLTKRSPVSAVQD
jgi:polyhydroxybutyrate depolymerase